MCSLTCHYILIILISSEHHIQVTQPPTVGGKPGSEGNSERPIELYGHNHILQALKLRGQTKRETNDRHLANVSP